MRASTLIALALGYVILGGCVNPLPFGPGRVTVVTEDIRIAKVSDRTLFGEMISQSAPIRSLEVIQFDLSSDADFHSYFEGRQIQVRCTVDHNLDPSRITNGYGPYNNGVDLSSSPMIRPKDLVLTPRAHDGRFSYLVYAFVDLSATRLIDHSFRQFPLETMEFSELSCFVIGVTKAPVLFPRSNDFGLSREQFLKLIARFRSASNATQRPM